MATIFGFLDMGCTLAPPEEYDWTVHVWRQCNLMSNYFDHLLVSHLISNSGIMLCTHILCLACVCVFFCLWTIVWGDIDQFNTVFRPHHSTMYVDVACCYRWRSMVCWLVCQSLKVMSPAKMAEPIKMPFGLWTQLGPRNHILDGRWGVQIPMWRGNFEGQRGLFVKLVWPLVNISGWFGQF